jgi:uridine kinase
MKVCFLVTGIPRRFSNYLFKYLKNLESYLDYDVFVYFPKDNCNENYSNDIFQQSTLLSILENPRYKLLLLDSQEPQLSSSISRKQKNSILQWYRIYKCFQFVPSDVYDIVIRIRPDIEILLNPIDFAALCKSISNDAIVIPNGYEDQSSLNDHLAFGSYTRMKEYCSLFSTLSLDMNYSSYSLLQSHLQHVPVVRIDLPYKLALSDCKIIAITGDSASGKSTLMKYIQDIMPKDSSLCIETDSYHKWERGDSNWNTYTHLHPEANHLERMSEDMLRLKIGNNVTMVDYDHSTGKFTQEKLTKGKPFILFCGLHTLYTKTILKDIDLKIFLDTEESLQTEWKIKRDTLERNHTIDKVLESIQKRKSDSESYILPQKEHSNFLIRYSLQGEHIIVDVSISPLFSGSLHPFSDFFSTSFQTLPSGMIQYRLRDTVTSEDINLYLKKISHKLSYIPTDFQSGITGILQMLLFLLLFYENDHC